jgi:hypothetical protein
LETIDITWPNFIADLHNIKLGLALDGVNPYVDLSTNQSTWLVLFVNYKLPLWLTTKRFFCYVNIIDTREKNVRNENIDVYLEPLLEELEILWRRVRFVDVTKPNLLI